jgi:hypothetical protein
MQKDVIGTSLDQRIARRALWAEGENDSVMGNAMATYLSFHVIFKQAKTVAWGAETPHATAALSDVSDAALHR